MKPGFFVGILALLIWACSPVKEASKTSATLIHDTKDSTEYEIVIVDGQFDLWYLTNYNITKDLSEDYYRTKNLIATSNWNDYYRRGKYNRLIDSQIDYQPEIQYGLEVNRKLFWYFKYVESNYKIKLF